jgi:hypothetical protein
MGDFHFRKIFSSVGAVLIGIHLIGVIISFAIFSYQYAREHGFLSWLLFGEIIPALKSILWEVFLIIALIPSPTQSSAITSLTQDLWWKSEYPALVKIVSSADNSSVSTSYSTGPDGRSQVKLLLLKKASEGLVLKIEVPKEAIFSIDPKTGKKIPSETAPVITIRDHNLDGMPDDFNMEPSGELVYKEELTKDGFIKFRNTREHQSILMQWSVGIGFSINHFLHGIDSVMPRK